MFSTNSIFRKILIYYRNSLPWMFSRNLYTLNILLELIIFILLFNTQLISSNILEEYKLIIIVKLLLWIIFSYIINRYKPNYNLLALEKTLIRQTKKSLLLIIIFTVIELIFLKIFNSFDLIVISNLLIFNCLFISICIFVNLINNVIQFKIFKRRKKWLLLTNDDILFNKIDIYSNLKDLISIKDFDSIKKVNLTKFKGIIYSEDKRNNIFEEGFVNEIKNKKLEIISIQEWFHRYRQRIPVQIVNKKIKENIQSNFRKNKLRNSFLVKRIFELIFTILFLLASSPIFIIMSILIYLEDKGPIFYSQIRVGKNGENFRIWKLRSMSVNAEKDGIKWAKKNDKRVTKIGKILRRTRIDELPQLICVLEGKMNLIGPRPERPEFEFRLAKEIQYYNLRALIKPGITGWAQVNYHYGASINDSENKLSYDLYYLNNYSFLLDIFIFFKTIRLVLNARGSEPIN